MYYFSGPHSAFIALSCDTKVGSSKHFFAHWHNAKLCLRGDRRTLDERSLLGYSVCLSPTSPFSATSMWAPGGAQLPSTFQQHSCSSLQTSLAAAQRLTGPCWAAVWRVPLWPSDFPGRFIASQQGVSAHGPKHLNQLHHHQLHHSLHVWPFRYFALARESAATLSDISMFLGILFTS